MSETQTELLESSAPKTVESEPKPLIQFFVAGEPKGQPRARSFVLRGRGGKVIMTKTGQPIIRVNDPHTAENWKSQIALVAKPFVPFLPMEGPIQMDICFYFPRPKAHFRSNGDLKPNAPEWHTKKPDRDNCEKAVTDALKVLGMFTDDCQICAGQVSKQYHAASSHPGARILIRQL